MNIYNITKYHPAWMWYQEEFDIQFVSRGIKSTPKDRADLKKYTVNKYMDETGVTPERLAADIKKRTAEKKVHPLYGTD